MPHLIERDASLTAEHELVAHAYGESAAWTLGAEEEFMVLDPMTFDLTPHAPEIIARCADAGDAVVSSEVVQTVVEAATPVCSNPSEVETSLRASRIALLQAAEDVGCTLGSAGTHPFSLGPQPVTEGERYAAFAIDYPWITLEAATYGLHVHVGVPDADLAVQLSNALCAYLPHLLALSASSPFWRGEATGLHSTRVRLAQLCPRSGMPPRFSSFADYSSEVQGLVAAGAMADETHVWWFVRPHPRFGTVEVRICDGQSSLRRSAALVALVQATCAWLGTAIAEERPIAHLSTMLLEENLWRATRDGLDATVILGDSGRLQPMRQAIRRLLDQITDTMAELGSTAYLPVLDEMVERSDASAQIARHADWASMRDIVRENARATANGWAD